MNHRTREGARRAATFVQVLLQAMAFAPILAGVAFASAGPSQSPAGGGV